MIIVAGVLLLMVAAWLLGSGLFASWRAQQASAEVLAELDEQRPAPFAAVGTRIRGDSRGDDVSDMPTLLVGGYEYLGSLSIPSLDLNLPIAVDINSTLLAISPCRYQGSYLTSDLIVCGEGYASHFGLIGRVGIRDTVRLVASDGATYEYIVSNVETDKLDEIDTILHDWDLTLFTFNADDTCLVVRCVRVQD